MLKNHEWSSEENFVLNYVNDYYKGEYHFFITAGHIDAVNKLGERVLSNKVSKLYWDAIDSKKAISATPEEMKSVLQKRPYLGRRDDLY